MRLTADVVTGSLSYLNPLKERELDLRGHKIPTLENLGPARDQECIDFTDNDITILANFPLSPRLQTLLCARNRISRIEAGVAKSLPKLSTLVLTGNQVAELGDLVVLKEFGRLVHLSLLENPVAGKENYRSWVIYLAPSVRFLDFQKVKNTERERAKELFGTLEAPTPIAQNILASRSNKSFNYSAPTTNGTAKASKVKLSDKERMRVEKLIQNAKTLAEVSKLEKDISEGRIPPGVLDSEVMDET